MGVSKNRGKTPKMDGENNGKPYFLMDDFGGKPTIFGNIHMSSRNRSKSVRFEDVFVWRGNFRGTFRGLKLIRIHLVHG